MRNDTITEGLKVENITVRSRNPRLGWCGHVKRRTQEYVGRKTLDMVHLGEESEEDRSRE